MKEFLKNVLVSLLIGVLVGVAVMTPAAAIGAVKGGTAAALYWGRITGSLVGAVGLIFAGMRLFSADRNGGHYFRPGRTALELESEVLDEHRRKEKAYRETGSDAVRSGRWKVVSLWVAVGMVLSALIPELLMLLIR